MLKKRKPPEKQQGKENIQVERKARSDKQEPLGREITIMRRNHSPSEFQVPVNWDVGKDWSRTALSSGVGSAHTWLYKFKIIFTQIK